ncbi:aminotransferase class I/II-fold pyridoxal phosphate-dependent enzyme [Mycoplasmopsis equigenitalium]|uniref:Aminotransferase n=1 Tax=Mycoplasmopsis equigenitalium TaxID=114883 RepID=A0ABY5J257_9BACT|nr:aminotransferase class I/II-fold pyridoxal phosphate-dependent enzyme [Mycoplasmopsis equigenitalium]UUD36804.1 aminotransferase class I/II-fold pyridoxal phosphate-dependent enzyme [Mycoplasmopsis equigenitalium]
MVKINGVSLIERMLTILDKKQLSKIIIVVGYKANEFISYINSLNIKTNIEFIENPIFDRTNNIYSLALTKKEAITDDILLLESDLIFDENMIDVLIENKHSNLILVDKFAHWMDGTCLELNKNNTIKKFIDKQTFDFAKANHYFKTVNIYKFDKEFLKNIYFPALEKFMDKNGTNHYYEDVLKDIIKTNKDIYAQPINQNHKWYEIDDEQDLNIAESIFATGEEKLEKFQSRYGGYWRYPKLLDFCYLVNPYFPTQKMNEEIKYLFNELVGQYPSGLEVNSNLCAKIFNVNKEHIVVGNGAAELIKSVIESLEGNVGFIRPTFEEYPNRFKKLTPVPYFPDNDNFTYDAKTIINFFDNKKLKAFVLINPDNPTGNYLPKTEVLQLIKWAKKNNIFFIYDESFSDFADEIDNTLIVDEYLDLYENMVIIKSISKSYGIPGFRLGVLASSNKQLIKQIKKDVSIWNINSFAEYYLQIYEKYKKDYLVALEKIKKSRQTFLAKLKTIKEIRVVPTQANYVTIELLKGTSKQICIDMLENDIFIKDLTPKIPNTKKQWIRVAVRDDIDNKIFTKAIKQYFKK